MKILGRVALVALVAGALWAVTAWPRINDVETGRTPEYPDLQPRQYPASIGTVSKAVQDAIDDLPRWTAVGSGRGPEGAFVSAVHETLVFRFKDDVTVRIRREGGRTTLSARSHSRIGDWDFGQNARNLRELLAAVDARLQP